MNFALIEDYPLKIEVLKRKLASDGHIVVAEATTYPIAMNLVTDLLAGRILTDVVLLDANLTPFREDGVEGTELARTLVDGGFSRPILSISVDETFWPGTTYTGPHYTNIVSFLGI